MLWWIIIKMALKSLWANKLRSFLAVLGIIIGVGAVISMLALGAGARQQVMKRISAMGTNILIIRPGRKVAQGGAVTGIQKNLTIKDAQSIIESVPLILKVAPIVRGGGRVKYFNKNSPTTVIGTSNTYFGIRNFIIENGRVFSGVESESMKRIAILGPVIAKNLFGDTDSINKTIKINGINFRVIGTLKSKGDQGWFNPDDQVIIPYSTAMKQLFGLNYLHEIDIQAVDSDSLIQVQEAVSKLLRKQHKIRKGRGDDFQVFNQAEIIRTANDTTKTFTILLGCIASISLLVGGIGIMNIMLVTVTERTKEIGIRKAIGAKNADIITQFLIEAILISILGGFAGISFGICGAKIIEGLSDFTTVLEVYSIFLALLFSIGVGIFFGFYPAHRAALLDPIDALRYE